MHFTHIRLRCPQCSSSENTLLNSGMTCIESVFCSSCGYNLPVHDGIPDFATHVPLVDPQMRFIQKLNQSPVFSAFYESAIWRAFLTRLGSGISMDEELERVLALTGTGTIETVADLACGTGHYARAFSKKFPGARIYGLDISLSMLAQGYKLARRSNLTSILFLRGDIYRLPFEDRSIDRVNCCGALHLFSDVRPIWREISRILRPGGIFTGWTLYLKPGLEERFQRRMMEKGVATFFQPNQLCDDLMQAGLSHFYCERERLWLIFSATNTGTGFS
jgi:SAM-dependent methyltransferase